MKLSLMAIVIVLLAGITGSTASAKSSSLTVCASGCAFNTVQAAIDAASPGNVIAIEAGKYRGGIIVAKNLTLNGAGTKSTIFQGGSPAVTVNSGVRATIGDLTITGGSADVGGGVANNGVLTLDGVNVDGNTARDQGGGIYNHGSLLLQNSTVHGNHVDTPFGSGGGIKNSGSMMIRDSTISDNSAPAGGGVDNVGPLIMANSQVCGNAALLGGGISNSGLMLIRVSAINDNTAEGDPAVGGGKGGGIYNHGRMTLLNSDVTHNTASVDPYHVNDETGFGGGIYTFSGTVTLQHSAVSNNRAGRDGGGIYNDGGRVLMRGSSLTNNLPNDCTGCS